jgi:hypothetical protein
MSHALTAHFGNSDFNTAAVTGDTFVFDPFVFSAVALPVTDRTEDALAEKTAFFGLETAVIDSLGILHLAV